MDTMAIRRKIDSLFVNMMLQNEKSEQYFDLANDLSIKSFGKTSLRHQSFLYEVGVICFYEKKYNLASKIFIEFKSIRKETLGEDHPEYVQDLDLGLILYLNMSDCDRLAATLKEIYQIKSKDGNDYRDDFETQLAYLYHNGNCWDLAESIILNEINKERKHSIFCEEKVGLCVCLANIYSTQENCYEEAVDLYKFVISYPDANRHAEAVFGLSELYIKMRTPEKAEALLPRLSEVGFHITDWANKQNQRIDSDDYFIHFYESTGNYHKADSLWMIEKLPFLKRKFVRSMHDEFNENDIDEKNYTNMFFYYL